MDLFEADTHSFIVKIWLEETTEEAGQATWRGHITHVPGDRRHYVQNLDDITAFIISYLEKMGVKPGKCWQIKRWLQQCKLLLKIGRKV